jgi:hypothetical protein
MMKKWVLQRLTLIIGQLNVRLDKIILKLTLLKIIFSSKTRQKASGSSGGNSLALICRTLRYSL